MWDAEAVRDEIRAFVVEQLSHPQAVLICDETGFVCSTMRTRVLQALDHFATR